MKKLLLLLLGIVLLNVGVGYGVQYTVLYTDLAQTISVQHTFNPSGAPFLIGSNSAEIEVVDLLAEKATAFYSTPTRCSGTTPVAAGIDTEGDAQGCAAATASSSGYWQFPNTKRVAYCPYIGSGTALSCFGDVVATTGTGSASAASNTQGIALNITTSTLNANYGLVSGNQNYRTGNGIVFQTSLLMPDTAASRRVWIGLTNNTTATQMGSDTPGADFAAFRWTSASETTFKCVSSDTTTQTVTNSAITVDTSLHEFEIDLNALKTQVVFYIDGVAVCTHSSASGHAIPGSGGNANMNQIVRGINLVGGTATSIRVQWTFVESDK